MLEAIRAATKTWIAKFILFLITLTFAFWGVESYIRNAPGQDGIATVGSQKITSVEFNLAIQRQLDNFRAQFGGNISPSIMDNPEMRKQVLDQLIDQKLVTGASGSLGLRVGQETLRERIGGEPTFQVDGKFSQDRYNTFLKAQGFTAPYFESLLRNDMERQHFADSISATAFVLDSGARQYLRATEQSRDVAVVTLAPEQYAAQVKITPEQAKAYYDANISNFTIPEQVRAEYVELSVDTLAPQMQVKAEDVQKFFDANSARFVQREERKASHILINVAKDAKEEDKKAAKAKADSLYAQAIKNPSGFAELAVKNSQDTGSAVNGGDLGYFKRGAMVKAFEDAAFKAKKGEIVGPVLSEYGYHIIRVVDVRAEKGKTLAEATPEIEGELKKQAAQKAFAELAEKFSNAVFDQSTSLKAASDIVKIPVKQSQWVPKGGASAPPFGDPKLVAALFTDTVLKEKRNTEAVEIAPNDLVAARILEIKPAAVRPYAEVEAPIMARLARDEAAKLARKDGEDKLAALKAGKADVVKFPALLAVSRASSGGLQPQVIDAAMKAPTTSFPAYNGAELPNGGYVLVQVAKVNEPAAADDSKLQGVKQRILQSQQQQQLQSALLVLRAHSDVSIAKDAVDKKAQ